MNRIKTLIVDDEKRVRGTIRRFLEKDPEIEIIGEAADGARGLELCSALHPMLLILDIEMPRITGVELVEKLGLVDRPELVFVATLDKYAAKAFELRAADYLIKPLRELRFTAAIQNAKDRLHRAPRFVADEMLLNALKFLGANGLNAPSQFHPVIAPDNSRLIVKADGQLHFLDRQEIRWIEGQGDYIKIYLAERRLVVRKTMAAVATQLAGGPFARIHKSTIVNLACVRRVVPVLPRGQRMELNDGTFLAIGPRYRGVLDQFK